MLNIELLITLLLGLHIACGFISLFSASGALLSAKGQFRHRLFGKCFFYAMTGIFLTAIPLALFKHNLFLFLIAIFSYYLAFSGWRYAKNSKGLPTTVDWSVSIVVLVASVMMLGLGIYRFTMNSDKTIALLVFGTIGFLFSLSDLKTYRDHAAIGKQRIVRHLSAMLGATIAALTAFSVTNITLKPQIILWLGPTVLLVPVIIWWKRKVLSKTSNF